MEPMYRIAQARKDAGLTSKEFAKMLGVDTTTLSNWESGRRQPTLGRLILISRLLNVGAAYLLGIDEQVDYLRPVDRGRLPALHRMPVWAKGYGWALVNSIEKTLVFADRRALPLDTVQEPLYLLPPSFACGLRGIGPPLGLDGIALCERVWVEPVSADSDLAAELRGWYTPRGRRLVENEYGNRFYFGTYGAKWLAFESCLDK